MGWLALGPRTGPDLPVSVVSGLLIAPDVVLTAAHVVACKSEEHVSFGIEVQHRNNAEAGLANVVGPSIVPKGFRCSNISEGVDLAVLKLSKKFTSAVIPGLDCNPLVGTFRPVCTSGGFTDIDAKGDPVPPFGDKNSATLGTELEAELEGCWFRTNMTLP